VLWGIVASLVLNVVLFLALTTQPIVEELGRVEGTVVYRCVAVSPCCERALVPCAVTRRCCRCGDMRRHLGMRNVVAVPQVSA